MKKVAIMQPYLFPYIGYWQLINAADIFVIFDDVSYIKKGWINRNNILINGKPHLFTIPVEKISQNKLINQTKLHFEVKEKEKFLKTITMAYSRSPYFKQVYPLIKSITLYNEEDLTLYIKNSIEKISEYLDLKKVKFILSSTVSNPQGLKAQDRIIAINKSLQADLYINPIGGIKLYQPELFQKSNIKLRFLKTLEFEYEQFGKNFVPNLSIIDVMMFNSHNEIKNILEKYELII